MDRLTAGAMAEIHDAMMAVESGCHQVHPQLGSVDRLAQRSFGYPLKSHNTKSTHHNLWQSVLAFVIACILTLPAAAGQRLTLVLGSMNDFDYLSDLLTQVLEAEGYDVEIIKVSDVPTSRLEWMLEKGDITAMELRHAREPGRGA